MKHKEPHIPVERSETIRQEVLSLLNGQSLTAREISGIVRVSEKDVYGHLEHIRRGGRHRDYILDIIPAECRKCGYVFKKRERLKKPGKCPVCRGESISEPLFSIRKQHAGMEDLQL